ncbi:unnamed protein product [Candidatus Paraburkholderia kirkii UZHbot1]|uniref:WGS project CAFE00000000 data, contig bkir_c56 n=1 Tax=Candidatus Paraburkholderia kirkii UZHbot1 TaxID=1055526 RepID=U3UAX9_9BURK|nr:unnamed protein product [Candidatus Paraburkholderia kirkii UZHbot1]
MTPDLITMAKAIIQRDHSDGRRRRASQRARHGDQRGHSQRNRAVPRLYVLGAPGPYSAHPVATAAAIATLDLYARDRLFDRAASKAEKFESAAHARRDAPFVKDIRNLGLVAGIELYSRDGAPGARV